MQAVLDWTYANVSEPEQIFVTGSSAGAIPSPFYAALIADHYTEATVTQLGDGAGGYRRMNNDTAPTNLGAPLTSSPAKQDSVTCKATR